MNNYKPEYLGKVIPADSDKLLTLIQKNFEGFSNIYDACKKYSDKITDVQNASNDGTTLSIRVITDDETLNNIKNDLKETSLSINRDIISAEPPKEN